jgi:surface polysaccharide O-acyltransferase-like enzyme
MATWAREVQLMKGVGIFAIIAIHTTDYYEHITPGNVLGVAGNAIDSFCQFAVPLFVFASGFVLAMNYSGSFPKGTFYKRRAAAVIPAYLIFSTLYLAVDCWPFKTLPSARWVVYAYLTGNAAGIMWFIPLIVQFYLLYPFLLQAYDRYLSRLKAWQIALPAVVVQSLYSAAILWYGPIANSDLATNLANRFFLGYIAYFVVGMYVGRNLDAVRAWAARLPSAPVAGVALVATGAIVAIYVRNAEEFGSYFAIPPSYFLPTVVLEPILYFSVFLVLLKWSLSMRSRIVRTFGDYSLWLYLLHYFLITVLEVPVFASFGIVYTSWVFYPLVFGITCILCLVSVFLLARVPYNSLVGGPRRNPARHGTDVG